MTMTELNRTIGYANLWENDVTAEGAHGDLAIGEGTKILGIYRDFKNNKIVIVTEAGL